MKTDYSFRVVCWQQTGQYDIVRYFAYEAYSLSPEASVMPFTALKQIPALRILSNSTKAIPRPPGTIRSSLYPV